MLISLMFAKSQFRQ